jgi:glycosyltransferase involved in cell wall biosynthesis
VVHGNQPGGTSLGLLKALGLGTCVLTLDTPDNAYAVGDAGCLYKLEVEDLREQMQMLLDNPSIVALKRGEALARAEAEYQWEVVAERYDAVLAAVAARGRRHARRNRSDSKLGRSTS